ncbi:MAG: hypothetical protein ABMB14_23595 [Myxococcota bacterium]
MQLGVVDHAVTHVLRHEPEVREPPPSVQQAEHALRVPEVPARAGGHPVELRELALDRHHAVAGEPALDHEPPEPVAVGLGHQPPDVPHRSAGHERGLVGECAGEHLPALVVRIGQGGRAPVRLVVPRGDVRLVGRGLARRVERPDAHVVTIERRQRPPDQPDLLTRPGHDRDRAQVHRGVPQQQDQGEEVVRILRLHVEHERTARRWRIIG